MPTKSNKYIVVHKHVNAHYAKEQTKRKKKIHTNQTLFSARVVVFFFFVLLRTNQMWSKTDLFIQKHSKTEKENKRSDTQTQKYATTRPRWERQAARKRWRPRERQVTMTKKKNLHTNTQCNQNKKCIQPQKSCARCYYCFFFSLVFGSLLLFSRPLLLLFSHCLLCWNGMKRKL